MSNNYMTSKSTWITVASTTTNYPGWFNVQTNHTAGAVRWNPNTSNYEIWDGMIWKDSPGMHIEVNTTSALDELLDWAKQRMEQEKNLEQRMSQHPGLRDAWERFQIMEQLTRDPAGD